MEVAVIPRVVSRQQHADALNRWSFTRIAAPPALAGLIDGYCDYSESTTGFSTRRELPHAEGVLIFNLGLTVRITGGDGRALDLRAGEAFVAGIHLRPALSHSFGAQAGLQVQLPLATLRRLLGLPMQHLLDQVVDLRTLWGATASADLKRLLDAETLALRIAALDTLLWTRLRAAPLPDRRQLAALKLLREAPGLDLCAVAERVGWSRKHLADRTQDLVGIGPRSFRRVLRFQQLQQQLRGLPNPAVDWSALAVDCGYFDQSHLIREFREFARLSPGEFLRRRLDDGGGLVEA